MPKWTGAALFVTGIALGLVGQAILTSPAAQAQTEAAPPPPEPTAPKAVICEWATLEDMLDPDVKHADWKRMGSAGYQLKVMRGNTYIFERCR